MQTIGLLQTGLMELKLAHLLNTLKRLKTFTQNRLNDVNHKAGNQEMLKTDVALEEDVLEEKAKMA